RPSSASATRVALWMRSSWLVCWGPGALDLVQPAEMMSRHDTHPTREYHIAFPRGDQPPPNEPAQLPNPHQEATGPRTPTCGPGQLQWVVRPRTPLYQGRSRGPAGMAARLASHSDQPAPGTSS